MIYVTQPTLIHLETRLQVDHQTLALKRILILSLCGIVLLKYPPLPPGHNLGSTNKENIKLDR